jgi:L-2-hydroxyglutarate oxidase
MVSFYWEEELKKLNLQLMKLWFTHPLIRSRPAYLINCAGLHSDRITELGGEQSPAKIIPFKGEYFELTDDSKHLCKNLIYPVPDPEFPFLGVHFTRMIDNSVECGPNAVLAFGREAYGKFDLNVKDLLESIFYPGISENGDEALENGLG